MKEFRESMKYAGVSAATYYGHKIRNFLSTRQCLLEELVALRNGFIPDLVIGPSLHDFHQDHKVVAEEMVRAFKTSASIICYERPRNHITFNTELFVKLQDYHIEEKLTLLTYYKSQSHRSYFESDVIVGQARTRGVQCGAKYAEAYEVLRWIL